MKGITITSIATLLALYLAAYGPWRTGGGQGEQDSAGGLNVAQDNSPATGALDVKQSVKNVQQPVNEIKQRVTDTRGAKRHGKGVKRSMADMRRYVKQRGENLELQIIETQDVEQLTIDVMQPTKNIKVVSMEFEELSGEPVDMEDMKDSSDWPLAHRINLAVPERQECSTPYEVWLQFRVQ